MEKVSRGFASVNRVLQTAEKIAGSTCLGVLFVVMIVNAMLRYLFQSGFNWSDELNQFLFVWLGFLAAAYTMGSNAHLNVTAFVGALPKTARYNIAQLMNVTMLFFFIIYIGPLFQLMAQLAISNVMRIPLKYVYGILPVCFILMCFHIVNNIVQDTAAFLSRKGEN